MAKFKKKPIVVDAFQLTYDAVKGRTPIPIWAKEANDNGILKISYTDMFEGSQTAVIMIPGGGMKVEANDWIIKNEEGDIYFCKNEHFDKNYEAVTD